MANFANGDLEFSPMKKKDCFFFVQYGVCSYGQTCRFNHPPPQDSQVVQEGRTNSLYANYNTKKIPCKFYLAGFCKYGIYCDFNHAIPDLTLQYNSDGLPMRLDEPVCTFYMRNLWCGYGAFCKFHHPELKYSIPQKYDSHASDQAEEYDDGLLGSTDE
ncbi:hypothetical protein SSX86_016123 [Deinandra increscens subsp. villosa]|uniref:C3H1-type domain-containing protein n=1 Tax=Deinandra increscens subsp. villosa TaxID=3103831 RepID=A0AAP0GWV4_9ASTR